MDTRTKRFRSVRARPLREEIAEVLREAVLAGELEPGQRLIEAQLAKEMGVSRFPVREAIRQLEQQGLVTVIPNQGAYVMSPSPEESYQALALRMYLEVLAARLAAAHADPKSLRDLQDVVHRMADLRSSADSDAAEVGSAILVLDREFHQCLMEAAGSELLSQIWSNVGPRMWAAMHYGRIQRGEWPRPSGIEGVGEEEARRHQCLVDALRSGDMDRAEESFWQHCEDSFLAAGVDKRMLDALRWSTNGSPLGGLVQPVSEATNRGISDRGLTSVEGR